MDANAYTKGLGLNLEVWTGCHYCGTCAGIKIKCNRSGGYELQLLPGRGVWNIFKNGSVTHSGRIESIKEELDKLVL